MEYFICSFLHALRALLGDSDRYRYFKDVCAESVRLECAPGRGDYGLPLLHNTKTRIVLASARRNKTTSQGRSHDMPIMVIRCSKKGASSTTVMDTPITRTKKKNEFINGPRSISSVSATPMTAAIIKLMRTCRGRFTDNMGAVRASLARFEERFHAQQILVHQALQVLAQQ